MTFRGGAPVLADPEFAQDTLKNAELVRGHIVLARRGRGPDSEKPCSFVDKAKRAAEAGAIALLVINNNSVDEDDDDSSLKSFMWRPDDACKFHSDAFTQIPVFGISAAVGQLLIDAAAGCSASTGSTADGTSLGVELVVAPQ